MSRMSFFQTYFLSAFMPRKRPRNDNSSPNSSNADSRISADNSINADNSDNSDNNILVQDNIDTNNQGSQHNSCSGSNKRMKASSPSSNTCTPTTPPLLSATFSQSTYTSTAKYPTRKRARFAKETTTRECSRLFSTQAEYDRLWYRAADYTQFRYDIQILCNEYVQTSDDQQLSAPQQDILRGLELLTCQQRYRNRCLAIKFIATSSRRSGHHFDYVALVSLNCSAWAREAATAQGARDFLEVYHPEWLRHIPQMPKPLEFSFKLPPNKKRQIAQTTTTPSSSAATTGSTVVSILVPPTRAAVVGASAFHNVSKGSCVTF